MTPYSHAVKWLIVNGVLADRGALGTDTFGPDPGTDALFRELAGVPPASDRPREHDEPHGPPPAAGAWIVVGGPRNSHGSVPRDLYGLVP